MKPSLLLIILFSIVVGITLSAKAEGQTQRDSLYRAISQLGSSSDSSRIDAYNALSRTFWFDYHDSVMYYAQQALALAETSEYKRGIADALNNIGYVHQNRGEYEKALRYHFRALSLRTESGDIRGIGFSCNNIGNTYVMQGRYKDALEYHYRALQARESIQDSSDIAWSLNNIGWVYESQENYAMALEHRQQAIEIFRRLGNKKDMGWVLNHMGGIYLRMGEYTSATTYFEQSLAISDSLKEKFVGTLYINLAQAYTGLQRYEQAIVYAQSAVRAFQRFQDTRGTSLALLRIAEIYITTNNILEAEKYASQALALAEGIGARAEIRDIEKVRADIFARRNDFTKAYTALKHYSVLRDSLASAEVKSKTEQLRNAFEMEKKEKEIELLKKEHEFELLMRWSAIILVAVLITFIVFLLKNYYRKKKTEEQLRSQNAEILRQQRVLEDQAVEIEIANTNLKAANLELETYNQMLDAEKERVDTLLLKILPSSIVDRMHKGEHVIADRFESVTVLFADIVGFTALSTQIPPEELVQKLNTIFSQIDTLAAKWQLEKIKTIGDSYMVAGGLPTASDDHCLRVAHFAVDLLAKIPMWQTYFPTASTSLNIRIGMHTGSVVAGVIGSFKFSYDVWGDTVNIASRMESHGFPGTIHCSEEVYQALEHRFAFEERGTIDIKGKGNMKTYYLLREK